MMMKLLKTTVIGAGLLAMTGTAQADTFGPNDVSGFAELFFSHTFLTDLGPQADPDNGREYAVHGLAHAGWRDSDRGCFGQDSLQSVDRTGASQGFFNPAILQTAYDQ
jgi:hypothetical protein